MRYLIKEYGYLAVMCVCLVCCAVLLASVTTDRPLVAIATHRSSFFHNVTTVATG